MFIFPSGIPSGAGGYQPAGALWLDGSADYLSWTPSSGSSNTSITYSFWAKRAGGFASYGAVLAGSSGGGKSDYIRFSTDDDGVSGSDDALNTIGDDGNDWNVKTTPIYRDPTAWSNYVVSFNNTSDIRIWVNGTEVTAFNPNTESGTMGGWLRATEQFVGKNAANQYFNGYLADVICLDGTNVTNADNFGELSDGIWVPKDPSDISSFGTNGFWLAFDDPTHANGVGKDSSGNNNHFTPTSMGANNIAVDGPANSTTKEVTIHPCYDINNPVLGGSTAFSSNNLAFTVSTGSWRIASTTIPLSSGKYYFEVVISSIGSANIGVATHQIGSLTADLGVDAFGWGYENGGNKKNGNSSSSYGNSYTSGNVVQVAIDLDNKAIYFGKDNTWQNSGDPTSGSSKTNAAFTNSDNSFGNVPIMPVVALHTSGTATIRFDSDSWSHSAPSGYSAITSTLTGVGNHATLNAISDLWDGSSPPGLSQGNLKLAPGSDDANVPATLSFASGKFYFEALWNLTAGSGNIPAVGFVDADVANIDSDNYYFEDSGNNPSMGIVLNDPGGTDNNVSVNGSSQGTFDDCDNNDLFMFAIDAGTGKFWVGKNGSWCNSVNPNNGSGQVATASVITKYLPLICQGGSGSNQGMLTVNFGASPFRYPPSTINASDFLTLNTFNITSGYTGSLSDAIVTTNATEANIKSTTESAHSFSNWISILYNRDASEQRIFYASDDSSNYIPFCDDGVLGKNSFPTLAGSNNWTGCAIATGASTGIATGTISHSTNGSSDSTAAHGLTSSTSRFSILISSEATSGHDGWFWFHPAMSSGNNIRMAQGGSEAQQNSKYYAEVTSSNAVVKSAAPNGTYRYIVFAENDLISLYSYTNMGSDSDTGIFVNTNNKPEWMLWSQMTETGGGYGSHLAWKGTHNPYNPWTKYTRLHNISTNELTENGAIITANGFQSTATLSLGAWRQANSQTTCGISIGTPFPLNNRAR